MKFNLLLTIVLVSLIIVTFSLSSFFLSYRYSNGQIAGKSTFFPTTISVSIGEGYRFSLFGFSSPGASIVLEGTNIFDQTYANNYGYFEFMNRFSPLASQEVCLTAQDQFGRLSTPTCLPPFPTNYNVSIGPVILPPTISLDKNDYYVGDEVVLSGQTIPNTDVNFSLFAKESDSHGLIKSTYAFTFPDLSTKSDEKGNFSLSIPSANPNSFNVFTQAHYQNSSSPKSVTLNFKILPVWMIIVKIFLLIFSVIKSRLVELIILIEVVYLSIYLYKHSLPPHVIARNRALALSKLSLVLREKMEIVPFPVN